MGEYSSQKREVSQLLSSSKTLINLQEKHFQTYREEKEGRERCRTRLLSPAQVTHCVLHTEGEGAAAISTKYEQKKSP